MSKAASTHDIVLNIGGTDYGFMLAKDGKGAKIWRVEDAEITPPGYITGAPGYENTPTRIEIPLSQTSFVGGFGQVDQDGSSRFYNADGADAGEDGRVYAGPAVTTESYIAGLTVTNGGAESGDTTGWTVDSGSLSASSTQANEGTYSFRLSVTVAHQDLAWDASYVSKIIMVTAASCSTPSTSPIKFGVNDGQTTTWSDTVTSPSWTGKSVVKTLAANASRIRIILDGGAASPDFSYIDTIQVCFPVCFCNFGGTTYLARGAAIQSWTGSAWTVKNTFPHTITDLKVFGSNMYIAQSDDYPYYYTADGTTYTLSTAAQKTFDYFGTVGTTFIGADDPNSVWYTINPVNGGTAWTQVTGVGDTTNTFTDVLDHPDTVIVLKTDGAYYLSASWAVSYYLPEMETEVNANTGKNSYIWKGDIFMPYGVAGLLKVGSTSDVEDISPSSYAPDQSTYRGAVKAITGDSQFLYIIVVQSTTATLMKGREVTVGSETKWRWYPLATFTVSDVYDALITVSGTKYLMIATDDNVVYFNHPETYGDLTADTNYRFDISGDFYSCWEHAEFKGDNKAWHSITVLSESLGTGTKTILVYYRTTRGSSWTLLGTADASPSETLYWAASNASTEIQFKFILTSSASTATPIFKGYVLKSKLRNYRRKVFTFAVYLAEKYVNLAGAPEAMDIAKMGTILRSANTATWPITLYDIDNATFYIDFQNMTEEIVKCYDSVDQERIYYISAIESAITTSSQSGSGITLRYDADLDGLIDASAGGTEWDSSAETGFPYITAGTWSSVLIGRGATYVVAASDAPAHVKAQADFVVDGTDDDVEILTAITALPTAGGTIALSAGHFHIANTIAIIKNGVTIQGKGHGFWEGGVGAVGATYWTDSSVDGLADIITINDVNGGGLLDFSIFGKGEGVTTDGIDADNIKGMHFRIHVKDCTNPLRLYTDSTATDGTGNTMFNQFEYLWLMGTNPLSLDGNAAHDENCCHNVFLNTYLEFSGNYGLVLGDCDGNEFVYLRPFRTSGSGKGIHFKERARANIITRVGSHNGLDVDAGCTIGNVILYYDRENGEPVPTIAAGGMLDWWEYGTTSTQSRIMTTPLKIDRGLTLGTAGGADGNWDFITATARFKNLDLTIAQDVIDTTINTYAYSTLLIGQRNTGGAAMYVCRGGGNATVEVWDILNDFTVTKDNAGTVNIYYDAGYKIQNKTAGSVYLTMFIFRFS